MANLLSTLAVAASVGGTLVQARGQYLSGVAESNNLKAMAKIRKQQGAEAAAASTREIARRARQGRELASRQQAVAAASGGGASDPSVTNLIGDTEAESLYQQASARYEGTTTQQGMNYQALIDKMNARQARRAGMLNSTASVLKGIGYTSKLPTMGAGSPTGSSDLRYG